MVKIRILKRQNHSYIELPQEMAGQDEIELFQLREGYYLLSVPLGQATVKTQVTQAETRGPLSESERALLKKLLSIKFENRTPAYVTKALDNDEKTVLRELERKGFVNVFKGTKYKDGVYNIRDSIYPLLSQKEAAGPKEAVQAAAPSPFGLLHTQGFMIIADKNEARILSERLADDMKRGNALGVKGFDGKFYIVTRDYFTKSQAAILAILKEDMNADAIAIATKLNPDGCRAVLRIMSENGDVLEKRRGIFAAV